LRHALSLILLVVLVSGLGACASSSGPNEITDKDVQRAAEGPTANEIFMSRFASGYGRVPTFEEMSAFRIELEEAVSAYLAAHPDVSTSPRASQFTFRRRVALGMTKEEVQLLAGLPYSTTTDEALMAAAAHQFWPAVKVRAREMWVYPAGWQFYFDGDRLVDLTVFGKPPL